MDKRKIKNFISAMLIFSILLFIGHKIFGTGIDEKKINTINAMTNKNRVIFRQCNINKPDIGCLSYIDNLRLEKKINIKKPLKKLHNMSINDFSKKYVIAFVNPNTGRIFKIYHFYYKKNIPHFLLKENKNFVTRHFIFMINLKKGKDIYSFIYSPLFFKTKKNGKLSSPKACGLFYIYSNKNLYISKNNTEKEEPVIYKGFQFFGICKKENRKDLFKMLKLIPNN